MAVTDAQYVIPTRPWPGGQRSSLPTRVTETASGGYLPLSGGTMVGNIDPDAGGAHELGTLGLYWDGMFMANLYTENIQTRDGSGHVLMKDDLDPNAGAAYDLGDVTLYWQDGYINDVYTDGIHVRSISSIRVYSDMAPSANNTYDLGSAALKWATLSVTSFATDNLTSASAQDNVTVTDDLDPNAGGTYDLGDATLYWAIGYIDKIFVNTLDDRSGGSIDLITNLISSTTSNIGDNNNYIANLYVQNLQSPTGGAAYIDCPTDIVSGSHFNLGDATRYWGFGFIDTVSMREITAPSGLANAARVFAQDNGAGKTQLMVIFGSGGAIQLAIEA